MKCPRKFKDCENQAIAKNKGNNFICAGKTSKPKIRGDIIRLCAKGKISDLVLAEMTPKEAIAICCVLCTAGYNNL